MGIQIGFLWLYCQAGFLPVVINFLFKLLNQVIEVALVLGVVTHIVVKIEKQHLIEAAEVQVVVSKALVAKHLLQLQLFFHSLRA